MTSTPESIDPFDLARFVAAQEGRFTSALNELKQGSKKSHWIWFIFPQLDGLGRSSTAKHYSIKSRGEAEAYLQHPLLRQRLVQCAEALLHLHGNSATEIMGHPDDMKFRSCMTLFASILEDDSVFRKVLDKYFQGHADPKTLRILMAGHGSAKNR